MFTNDLAISAVSYDTLLVGEMMTLMALRLGSTPAWMDASLTVDGLPSANLDDGASRLVLVLWQRLWGLDDVTAAEAVALRVRVRRAPRSVVVVTLDDAALPVWLARARCRSLPVVGLDTAVDFVLGAIADAGGAVLTKPAPTLAISAPTVRWSDVPTPFLGQTRAHSALRRELESLGAVLQAGVDVAKRDDDRVCELHKLPHRFVARLDDVGISFSWVPGRNGTVADGRLMVIEWTGVASGRGIAALRAAQPARECVYRVDAEGPDAWCWRADRPNGRASSTLNLANEWVAAARMMAGALETGNV
jgi:hypothetical protein